MHRRIVPLLTFACCICAQQTVQVRLDITADDAAEVYLNGEPVLRPKCLRPGLEDVDTVSVQVMIRRGTNVLGVKVTNRRWGLAVAGSMVLPSGDALRADNTWVCTYSQPISGWADTGYDVSDWSPPGDYGRYLDCSHIPFIDCLYPYLTTILYTHEARLVSLPRPTYFRKVFTAPAGAGQVAIRGNQATVTAYINGRLLGAADVERSTPTTWDAILVQGTNVVALEAVIHDRDFMSVDFLLKAGVGWGSGGAERCLSDSTWRVSHRHDSAWTDLGYDDTHWAFADTVRAYDPWSDMLTGARWIGPSPVYFRREFVWDGAMGVEDEVPQAVAQASVGTRSLPQAVYFDLRGRIVRTTAKALSGSVVLQRLPTGPARTQLRIMKK